MNANLLKFYAKSNLKPFPFTSNAIAGLQIIFLSCKDIMSPGEQVSIVVGQIENNVVGCFPFELLLLRGSLFGIIISYRYLLIIWLKNLSRHNVRPKIRFRRTWDDFGQTFSDDYQLFAALHC